MSATLLYRYRREFDDGAIVEMVLWRLPEPVVGSTHPFKYRLFYGYRGQRIIGYDNERPKGDHRHRNELEEPYRFEGPERLMEDFLADVARERGSRS